jgi:hypothetical protein
VQAGPVDIHEESRVLGTRVIEKASVAFHRVDAARMAVSGFRSLSGERCLPKLKSFKSQGVRVRK